MSTFAVESLTNFVSSHFSTISMDAQVTLLRSYAELQSGTSADVRSAALLSVLEFLQSHTEEFDDRHAGWPVILDVVSRPLSDAADLVDAKAQAAHIGEGFRSVQFLLSDCLASFPLMLLEDFVRIVGTYATQSINLNISLTAVNSLWTIGDYLQTLPRGNPAQTETNSLQGLWLNLFAAIASLCRNEQPETRNCAVRTLFKTLATHGSSLSDNAWRKCMLEVCASRSLGC